ncbi:MAG: hypothetical protein GC179_09920 [Anaerolineaceae bacterium]|nr:hypothetical protein [Anaerolineaceae bacterium]
MTEPPLTIDAERFDRLSNPTEDLLSQVRKIYQDHKNEAERRIAFRTWMAAFLTNVDLALVDTKVVRNFIAKNLEFIDEECKKIVDRAIEGIY